MSVVRRAARGARARAAALTFAAAAAAGLAGCATAPAPPPAPVDTAVPVSAADRSFLVPPASGYDLPLAPAVADALSEGHRALLEGRLPAARRSAAEAANAAGPAEAVPPPARVLVAQIELVSGDPAAAAAAAGPVAAELPTYVAAQLVLGAAHGRLDDPIAAFAAFYAIAGLSPSAAERVEVLRPRVVAVLSNEIEAATRAGELATAAEGLSRLQRWAPAAAETVRAAWRVAAARGDREGELLALRELAGRHGPLVERELLERRATLELAVGEPGTGVQLFEELVRAHPADAGLAERLASAKFLWRVTQLPPKVADAASMPELDRGSFAVLLYWLVPQVRYGGGGTARIASDILDDPRREEIARVINLGLLDIDATVHRFYPDNPLRRSRGLGALVGLLAANGVACAAGAGAEPGSEEVCTVVVGCGLVAAPAECTAGEGLSGSEALDMLRRAVELVGGS